MLATFAAAARTVMERCELLSRASEEPGRLTRRYATPPMRQVNEIVSGWMRDASMAVQFDAVGNLIGRYATDAPAAKTLLLGSHLDTVYDAGKYDGVLGVMVALICLERMRARGRRLPFNIELLAFADEEGLRYHSVYLGSRATTGIFNPDALLLSDADGVILADAMRAFGGNPDPAVLCTPRWRSDALLGYCEVHIEQGPVLEARDLPVAAVTGIAGQYRFVLNFTGVAGHAGTVPMSLRRDALCAAAEFILAVETQARTLPGLVATVGQLDLQPGASNVIPGQVVLSLDVRHLDDALREQAASQLHEHALRIGAERQVALSWQVVQESRTVSCAPELTRLWEQAIAAAGYPVYALPSGAGHDAVALSTLTSVAMLFVRCRAGISHNPAESVTTEDVAAAIAVLERFLLLLCDEQGGAL